MRKRIFFIVLFAVAILALSIVFLFFFHRPYDERVTVSCLSSVTTSEDYILAAVSDGTSSKLSYYEISGCDEFSSLFSFQDWSITNVEPEPSPLVVLRFAEGWILELYANGLAVAHNGYATRHTQSECFYSFPSDSTTTLTTYLSTFGQPHYLGDGTISTSTFHW